jgi:hypothetical protein
VQPDFIHQGPGPGDASSLHPCNDPNLSPEEFLQAVYQDQTFSMSLRVRAASGLVWSQYAKSVLHTPATSMFIPEGYSAELMARYPWSQDPGSSNGKSQSNSRSGEYNRHPQSGDPAPSINTETTPSTPNFEKFLYTVFYTSPLLRRLLTPEYHSSSADFRKYQ